MNNRYYVTFRNDLGSVISQVLVSTDLHKLISLLEKDHFSIIDIELLSRTDWVQVKQKQALIKKLADRLREEARVGLGSWDESARRILEFMEKEGMNGNPG